MFGKLRESFLLVVVLVLVLGFSGFLDYDYEDDDENERCPTFSKHVLNYWTTAARAMANARAQSGWSVVDEHQQTVQAMMAQPLAGSATPVLDANREAELDHVILNAAKRYYASGRTLTTEQLKEVFASMLEEARGMQRRYSGDIAQKARQVNVSFKGRTSPRPVRM